MNLSFSPKRLDQALELSVFGDTLVLNGEDLDLSVLPEGGVLPASAVSCDWIAGDISRTDGVLNVPLFLSHGPNAPEETRFPVPISVDVDGPVELPPYEVAQEQEEDTQ